MTDTLPETRPHPAKFSRKILDAIEDIIGREWEHLGAEHAPAPIRIIDPFAGAGLIHRLADHPVMGHRYETVGVEIEPEWATADPRTIIGDALNLPFDTGHFHAGVTSPCLEQGHRVLTDDLRWVPVGDVEVGDRLLAFDETGAPGATGQASRRRWRRAEVVRSVPRSVECVRVILANGDEIITTPEHPWLVSRYAYKGKGAQWIESRALAGYYVQRQVAPWTARTSFDAGWLSGMFDGEGSLSLGSHGSPKLALCQCEGPVLDRAERLMAEFGYDPNRITRPAVGDRRKVGNLYVTGGFPAMLRALGELRPTRLLDKWADLDVSTRTVQAEKIAVLGVEPAGRRDIQEIETTEGTYFGEGYLHHNCYGNRMADHHEAADPCRECEGVGYIGMPDGPTCSNCRGSGLSKRNTYRHQLGRMPTPGSTAVLPWGATYRALHRTAWDELVRVLVEDGLVVLNVSNHIAGGEEQEVVEWHANEFLIRGCRLVEARRVKTPRNGQGENGTVRVDGELVLVFRTPRRRRLL